LKRKERGEWEISVTMASLPSFPLSTSREKEEGKGREKPFAVTLFLPSAFLGEKEKSLRTAGQPRPGKKKKEGEREGGGGSSHGIRFAFPSSLGKGKGGKRGRGGRVPHDLARVSQEKEAAPSSLFVTTTGKEKRRKKGEMGSGLADLASLSGIEVAKGKGKRRRGRGPLFPKRRREVAGNLLGEEEKGEGLHRFPSRGPLREKGEREGRRTLASVPSPSREKEGEKGGGRGAEPSGGYAGNRKEKRKGGRRAGTFCRASARGEGKKGEGGRRRVAFSSLSAPP